MTSSRTAFPLGSFFDLLLFSWRSKWLPSYSPCQYLDLLHCPCTSSTTQSFSPKKWVVASLWMRKLPLKSGGNSLTNWTMVENLRLDTNGMIFLNSGDEWVGFCWGQTSLYDKWETGDPENCRMFQQTQAAVASSRRALLMSYWKTARVYFPGKCKKPWLSTNTLQTLTTFAVVVEPRFVKIISPIVQSFPYVSWTKNPTNI